MVESRMTRGPIPAAWSAVAAAAVGLASIGCTMCPDPFDYSGPVPNGSPPQNDFRARSNGILPLGAAPRPWPLLVDEEAAPAATPEGQEPTTVIADEGDAGEAGSDGLRQTAAMLPDAGDGHVESERGDIGQGATETVPPDLVEPVPAEASSPAPVARSQPTFQIGETPGWRARQR